MPRGLCRQMIWQHCWCRKIKVWHQQIIKLQSSRHRLLDFPDHVAALAFRG
ncbi:hypothetical protein RchiOBHm_Chr7g0179771 [Rosa chinensis]|uniref:Uncharacterized protein n=1 Tax=Rosa chinensis TaxID=74649 RepID=A0A2P6P269_ROSCH|nr:hypothetical protein RchiOBHm_Chr7g0179771 [Rosa chinensis]